MYILPQRQYFVGIKMNPAFESLHDNPEYKSLLNKLEQMI